MTNLGFWTKFTRPVHVMAPLANVTDSVFRQLFAKYSKPDVFWSEFISCDGLCSEGRDHLAPDLYFTEKERPIVLQIFGSNPDTFYESAKLGKKLGYDGIDINMGCPDRSVERQGAGAALIKDPTKVKSIMKATKEGAGKLPVSIKTRIGYNKDATEEWVEHLLETEPAVITIHARTRKEMSNVPANWDTIKRAVNIRNKHKSKTLILGNGDVMSIEEGEERIKETGCDGVMYGRALFGNPWLFNTTIKKPIPVTDRLMVMLEHTELFEKTFGDVKNFAIMKKHFKAYVSDFDGSKELRNQLMETNNSAKVREIVASFLTE